jgi:hypothetical protein
VALFVIAAAQLMVVLDTAVVNVALPPIQHGIRIRKADLAGVNPI